jgi:coenzyme F420-reducing hydrogenase delta subunit
MALFYCRNTPGSSEQERQALEEEYPTELRLFPLPCGGRLDPIHLMKALEGFADAAYLIACPEGGCRYHEGNTRARKRVERTAEILAQIGLEKERVGIVVRAGKESESLGEIARRILAGVRKLGPSAVRRPFPKRAGPKVSGRGVNDVPAKRARGLKIGGPETGETARMEQR